MAFICWFSYKNRHSPRSSPRSQKQQETFSFSPAATWLEQFQQSNWNGEEDSTKTTGKHALDFRQSSNPFLFQLFSDCNHGRQLSTSAFDRQGIVLEPGRADVIRGWRTGPRSVCEFYKGAAASVLKCSRTWSNDRPWNIGTQPYRGSWPINQPATRGRHILCGLLQTNFSPTSNNKPGCTRWRRLEARSHV